MSDDFTGLLFVEPASAPEDGAAASYAADLNLDQVVDAAVRGEEEPHFVRALLYHRLSDVDAVHFRQEIFRDLEDSALFAALDSFASKMRQVRTRLDQLGQMSERYYREGWQLDAAAIYCEATRSLSGALASASLCSRGLVAFRSYLDDYLASPNFTALDEETSANKQALAQIRYCTRIRGGKVEVSRYADEPDYSAVILECFERFQQGAATDYRVTYRTLPGINHVAAHILELVARLFPDEFDDLDEYCGRHADFLDAGVRRFERELHFYSAYAKYIAPLREAGLPFCFPEVSTTSKEVFARDTFDLALAAKLTTEGNDIVLNSFELTGPERIFVVTGPNQGGKTTFARTFGLLHHLASLGCEVPGTAARLFLADRLLTHFEREEELARQTGKLEDDIVRVSELLGAATSRSAIILNEVFTSTTLDDARFLGTKLMRKLVELDCLCLYVTFVDELASLGDCVVSMMSTVVPDDPASRTYKVLRRPADGLAYALAVAERHGVTYEALRRRLAS